MPSHRLLTASTAILIAALAGPPIAAAQISAQSPSATAPSSTTMAPSATAPSGAAPAASASAKTVAPAGDLVETARASGQFTTFIKALDETNLTGLLKTRSGLTVFAPTDAAFAALPAGELDRLMADKPALQKLLTHHIINLSVDSTKIAGSKGPVTTVANDAVVLDGSDTTLKADNASIVQADVRASNGILHVVDQVLTPGSVSASVDTSATTASTSAPAAGAKAATGTKPAVRQ